MTAPRFFHPEALRASGSVTLDPDAAHHARDVLRMSVGDPLILIGDNGVWTAEIASVDKRGVTAAVLDRSSDEGGELPVEITVLQAVIKGAKFDDVVEKTVEL